MAYVSRMRGIDWRTLSLYALMLSFISILRFAAAIRAGSFCWASYFFLSILLSDAYHASNLACATSEESFRYNESSRASSSVSPAAMRESRTWNLVVESLMAM